MSVSNGHQTRRHRDLKIVSFDDPGIPGRVTRFWQSSTMEVGYHRTIPSPYLNMIQYYHRHRTKQSPFILFFHHMGIFAHCRHLQIKSLDRYISFTPRTTGSNPPRRRETDGAAVQGQSHQVASQCRRKDCLGCLRKAATVGAGRQRVVPTRAPPRPRRPAYPVALNRAVFRFGPRASP